MDTDLSTTEQTLSRSSARYFAETITIAGPDLCVATPCPIVAPLLRELAAAHPHFGYTRQEDNAVALASGVAMAGGRAVVVMRNSGSARSAEVMASVVEPFRPSIGIVIGRRGTDSDTTGENRATGRITAAFLGRLDIPFRPIGAHGAQRSLDWFGDRLRAGSGPAVLLISPEFFGWCTGR